jgi:hypothetical protein
MKQRNIEVKGRTTLGRISSATLGGIRGQVEPAGLFTPVIQLS